MPLLKSLRNQKDNRSSTSIGSSTNHSPQSQAEQSILAGTAPPGGYGPPPDQRRPAQIIRSSSQSQRNFPAERPPVDVARGAHGYAAEEPPPDQQQYLSYNPQASQQAENGILAPVEEPKSRFRDRIGFGKLGHSSNRENVDRLAKNSGLSRQLSTKKREAPPNLQNYQPSTEEQYRRAWQEQQQQQRPVSNLQVTHEGDEHANIVPSPSQGYSPYIQQQEHFPPPPTLRRVDTDQSSSHQHIGNEPYSPTEQNTAYHGQQIHPNQQQYQAFQPSPVSTGPQHHEIGEHPPQYFQPNSLQQAEFRGSQYLQPGNSPVPLQQHQYSNQAEHPSLTQPAGQFPDQDAPNPHLQQQPQLLQQVPPNLHLQPGRPPSQQGLASPTQPQPQYQAYGSAQPSQQHPLPAPPQQQQQQQGVHPQQQEGSILPLHKQSRGQDKQPQPSVLSRENTVTGQPGQKLVSGSGIATFPAGVVPQVNQGQAFNKNNPQQLSDEEIGRDTPTPHSATDSMPEDEGKAFAQLQDDHRILKEKYNKVKKHYFDKDAQVHALQNALAHHRLSQSRTSLDDTEYFQRFDRLQGFIKELAYNIRKDWKTIPTWLHGSVNKEAIETGKQEMTAVGRAYLTRWLMEELFDKHFHPDLDSNLSQQLKQVQNNIRRYAPISQAKEDEEQLSAKVTAWRLATLEGLQDVLRSAQAAENRRKLITLLQNNLIADMQKHLFEPPPRELDGGVHMIIELVIERIAVHIPQESRDVVVEYFPPGHTIVSESMKIEACPALTNPIAGDVAGDAAERASLKSTASDLAKDGASVSSVDDLKEQEKARNRPGGLLTGVFGTGKKPQNPQQQQVQGRQGDGSSQISLTQPPGSSAGPKDEAPPARVRMAACMGVRIRGRQGVLYKAPVFAV